VTLSDIFLLDQLLGGAQSKQQNWRRRKEILLYANKMHGTSSMVGTLRRTDYILQKETTLGREKEEEPDIGLQNSNVNCFT